MNGASIRKIFLEKAKNGELVHAYNGYGNPQDSKLFTILFNDYPSSHVCTFNKLNVNRFKETADKIIDRYSNDESFLFFKYYETTVTSTKNPLKVTSLSTGELLDLLPEPCQNEFKSSGLLPKPNSIDTVRDIYSFTFIWQKLIITFEMSNIGIYYIGEDRLNEGLELFKDLFDSIKNEDIRTKPLFNLVCSSNGGFYLKTFESDNYNINIDETYNDDFKTVDSDIRNFISSNDSGLVILHGLQGTGKTTYIRHLLSSTDKEVMYMSSGLISNLDSPNFIEFLSDHKDSIIIAEDSEELLKQRCSGSGVNNGIVNILNVSDGILGDVFKIKFICTFNAKLSDIDKALQRKGRLKARYEFKELKADKVRNLNDKYNLGIPDEKIKDMPLSDIFNYDDSDFTVKLGKIGL